MSSSQEENVLGGEEVKLYVGNLSYNSDENRLREAFAGDVTDVFIPTDRNSGRPRGFAFVTYGSRAGADEAIRTMDQTEVDGRTIRVNESRPRGEQGGGGGGGYQGGGGGVGFNSAGSSEVKLYVGNLSYNSDENRLREAFAGDVTDVFIPTDRNSGRPRGFAFVTYGSRAGADEAIRTMDQTEVDGRTIRVNESRPRGEQGGGGGGGYQGGGGGVGFNSAGSSEVKLYVGNLSYNSDENRLREAFAGDVTDVFIPTDRNSGRPRGFAFVTYGSRAGADEAIRTMDQTEVDGRTIRVNESRPRGDAGINANVNADADGYVDDRREEGSEVEAVGGDDHGGEEGSDEEYSSQGEDQDPFEAFIRSVCSAADFAADRIPRFGTANPERVESNYYEGMIRRPYASAWTAKRVFDMDNMDTDTGTDTDTDTVDGPVWCMQRFGRTMTLLADGRMVLIAGEHEDFYDPDFYIYNDVIVLCPDGRIEMYQYPKDVFPQTDGHTATYIPHLDSILIIGCMGYVSQRQPGVTPIYRLNCSDWSISAVECQGSGGPGWISRHKASYNESEERIEITGGSVVVANANADGNGSAGTSINVREGEETIALRLADFSWMTIPQNQQQNQQQNQHQEGGGEEENPTSSSAPVNAHALANFLEGWSESEWARIFQMASLSYDDDDDDDYDDVDDDIDDVDDVVDVDDDDGDEVMLNVPGAGNANANC